MTNATDVLTRLRAVLQQLDSVSTDYCPLTQQLIKDMQSLIRAEDNEAPIEQVLELNPSILVATAYACQLLEAALEAHPRSGDMRMLSTLH